LLGFTAAESVEVRAVEDQDSGHYSPHALAICVRRVSLNQMYWFVQIATFSRPIQGKWRH
jgi:hypothetical protein